MIFLYLGDYIKRENMSCAPTYGELSSKNLLDAAFECAQDPKCEHFIDYRKEKIFSKCSAAGGRYRSSIQTGVTSILYTPG